MAKDISQDDFQAEVLDAKKLVLVDFWAPWCGPCKMLGPVVEEAAEDDKYKEALSVVKVNVDDNQDIAGQHGVMSIPTVKFFYKGEVVKEFVGVKSKEELDEMLDALLADHPPIKDEE